MYMSMRYVNNQELRQYLKAGAASTMLVKFLWHSAQNKPKENIF